MFHVPTGENDVEMPRVSLDQVCSIEELEERMGYLDITFNDHLNPRPSRQKLSAIITTLTGSTLGAFFPRGGPVQDPVLTHVQP